MTDESRDEKAARLGFVSAARIKEGMKDGTIPKEPPAKESPPSPKKVAPRKRDSYEEPDLKHLKNPILRGASQPSPYVEPVSAEPSALWKYHFPNKMFTRKIFDDWCPFCQLRYIQRWAQKRGWSIGWGVVGKSLHIYAHSPTIQMAEVKDRLPYLIHSLPLIGEFTCQCEGRKRGPGRPVLKRQMRQEEE